MTNKKEEKEDWRELCELIAHESDPQRLSELVDQLIRELDARRSALQQPKPATGGKYEK